MQLSLAKFLRVGFVVSALLLPAVSHGWWDERWRERVAVAIDGVEAGLSEDVADFPLLVRLHAGSFPYFLDLAEQGRDLRLSADDKRPLAHHLERLDAAGEVGLVWARVPRISTNADAGRFWLYFGNANVTAPPRSADTYDSHQALVFHFDRDAPLPRDETSYGNHAVESKAVPMTEGRIGDAALFSGNGGVRIAASPSLSIDSAPGWTASLWLKPDSIQDATVLAALSGQDGLELASKGAAWVVRVRQGGRSLEAAHAGLIPQTWQHVSLRLLDGTLQLFLNGELVTMLTIKPISLRPEIRLGDTWKGGMDEVQISGVARSPSWLRMTYRSQDPDFALLKFGELETMGAGPSYLRVILGNVTVDGWIVIGLTGLLFVVAVLVMALKLLMILGIRRANRRFIALFASLGVQAPSRSVLAGLPEQASLRKSPLYRLFRAGIDELRKLQRDESTPLSPDRIDLLRVRLDNQVAREAQRFNRAMVLLTIAISGGPFLGLLGTVVGVMITFAVIAQTGDVNINAIAPGIAAALAATVAGLAVAIPALFGYNYLLTQLKELSLELRLFKDEWLAWLVASASDGDE